MFPELVATEPKLTSEVDRLWEAANADAVSQSAVIESAIDYAQSHADVGIVEGTYRETIEDGVAAWEQLKRDTGFDLRGVFRRRQLIPFVFLPRHVAAKHGSAEKHSMLKNLQQAHEAFVFGTPLACLAMMRSIVEAVLREHYRAQGEDLKERIRHARNRLPREANEAALHRLRKSANAVLHLDPESGERLPNIEPIQLEKDIVSLLFVLRALPIGASNSNRRNFKVLQPVA